MAFGLVLVCACQTFADDTLDDSPGILESGGTFGSGGASTAPGGFGKGAVTGRGGAVTLDVAGAPGEVDFGTSCGVSTESELSFEQQRVGFERPIGDTFYSWMTTEEAETLRRTRVLLPVTDASRANRGDAFDVLATYRQQSTSDARAWAPLLQRFQTELFPSVRTAWPNPWANRLGFSGETVGDQLVQVRLKAEAWVLVVDGNVPSILTLEGSAVLPSDAKATPERIGAIFFLQHRENQRTLCDGPGIGYREFILGNEGMVESWSLATPDIRARSESDLDTLRSLFVAARTCSPYAFSEDAWNQEAVCAWQSRSPVPLQNYVLSLGVPSGAYQPTPGNLAGLIATLEADLPVGDPLIVEPTP